LSSPLTFWIWVQPFLNLACQKYSIETPAKLVAPKSWQPTFWRFENRGLSA